MVVHHSHLKSHTLPPRQGQYAQQRQMAFDRVAQRRSRREAGEDGEVVWPPTQAEATPSRHWAGGPPTAGPWSNPPRSQAVAAGPPQPLLESSSYNHHQHIVAFHRTGGQLLGAGAPAEKMVPEEASRLLDPFWRDSLTAVAPRCSSARGIGSHVARAQLRRAAMARYDAQQLRQPRRATSRHVHSECC